MPPKESYDAKTEPISKINGGISKYDIAVSGRNIFGHWRLVTQNHFFELVIGDDSKPKMLVKHVRDLNTDKIVSKGKTILNPKVIAKVGNDLLNKSFHITKEQMKTARNLQKNCFA